MQKRITMIFSGLLLVGILSVFGSVQAFGDGSSSPVSVELVGQPIVYAAEVPVITEPDISLTEDEIALIALVTMAEAEGESEYGKRLVIDTILNRVDSEYFPDTVRDVIYQKYHFSCVWNGRIDRCYVQNDICALVKEELAARTNNEVVFFNAKKYSKYGVPLFQEGGHYFSKYE